MEKSFISALFYLCQISEAMDLCVRRRLQLPTRRTYGKTDIPQISLGLLNSIFKSDFLHEKSYMQWKSRQVMFMVFHFLLILWIKKGLITYGLLV